MDLRKKSGFREKLLEEKMERLALSQDTRFDNISAQSIGYACQVSRVI
jgi:hypothetical protein